MYSIGISPPYRPQAATSPDTWLGENVSSPVMVPTEEGTVVAVQYLPFDTDCFGIPMGRLVAPSIGPAQAKWATESAVEVALSEGIEHLTARVPASDAPLIQALGEVGFYYADTHVTLLSDALASFAPKATIDPVRPSDVDAIASSSEQIFRESRFFQDPTLALEGTRKLYDRWVRNDCNGRADQVLVARIEDRPVGYIACLFNPEPPVHASIDLIAVFPEAQGRGIGAQLVRAALAHYEGRTTEMYVETQGGNRPALSLYQANGFKVHSVDITLHWHRFRTAG
jgi:dTDP-4-amino-4,6-dideoxy-D-galactose acyltransferase